MTNVASNIHIYKGVNYIRGEKLDALFLLPALYLALDILPES